MSGVIPYSTMAFTIDGAISTSSALKFVAPCDGRIVAVYGAVGTAPAGAAMLVDIHKGGTTIFTTQTNRLTIADGASSGSAAAVEVTDFAAGDVVDIDVDQVGSGTAGSDLTVTIAYEGAA